MNKFFYSLGKNGYFQLFCIFSSVLFLVNDSKSGIDFLNVVSIIFDILSIFMSATWFIYRKEFYKHFVKDSA